MFGFKKKSKAKTFWEILNLMDWRFEGNDDKVCSPVIDYLSKQSDEDIFNFDEQMTGYLYAIDGKAWAESYKKDAKYFSDDGFLYCRGVAIVNGEAYYKKILNNPAELNEDRFFETVIYIPREAWGKKHNKDAVNYPYEAKLSYETGSNEKLWK